MQKERKFMLEFAATFLKFNFSIFCERVLNKTLKVWKEINVAESFSHLIPSYKLGSFEQK
jgi:hypothetical protein